MIIQRLIFQPPSDSRIAGRLLQDERSELSDVGTEMTSVRLLVALMTLREGGFVVITGIRGGMPVSCRFNVVSALSVITLYEGYCQSLNLLIGDRV
jgi:hypothetical protein